MQMMRSAPAWYLYAVPARAFQQKKRAEIGAFVKDGSIVVADGNSVVEICGVKELLIPGPHNLENALAAAAMAYFAGIGAESIARTLRTFRAWLTGSNAAVKKRRFFVNDSKGTNPDAAVKAVLSFKNIILIAGGYDKGAEYGELTGNFDGHVKELVLMGGHRAEDQRSC